MRLNKYLFALTCTIAATAHADNNWYVLGSVGRSNFDASKSDIRSAVSPNTTDSVSLDNSDTGYKIQLGYQFTPNFAVEGGYIDLGRLTAKLTPPSYSVIPLDNPAYTKIKTSAKGWNLSAVGILPFNNGLAVFAKLGVIDAKVETKIHTSSLILGNISDTASTTDLEPLFGVGASYDLNSSLNVRLEVERYKNLGNSNTTGESDVDLVSAGLAYKF